MDVLNRIGVGSSCGAVNSTRRSAVAFFEARKCELARSYVERDAIFKLRYRSYLRAGLISRKFLRTIH